MFATITTINSSDRKFAIFTLTQLITTCLVNTITVIGEDNVFIVKQAVPITTTPFHIDEPWRPNITSFSKINETLGVILGPTQKALQNTNETHLEYLPSLRHQFTPLTFQKEAKINTRDKRVNQDKYVSLGLFYLEPKHDELFTKRRIRWN